ncbi:MAG TPA: hypothetical protein VKA89_04835 [Solirubrobacterales bacterium]|nr:hypothetical protein [Solirubrobacterales bacterium]
MTRTKIRTALVSLAVAATAFAGLGTASAATPTKVVIKPESGGFYGYVKSLDPACADGRTVVLYKQLGRFQDPRNDRRIGSDTTELNGDRYMWSTGNTGTRSGRFYARATRIPGCRPANSRTIPAQP